jgi:putative flippase GtrA
MSSRAKASALRRALGRGTLGQLLRYGSVVASGYLLAVVFYARELDLGISPYPALGVAFVLNGLFNFSLLRVWVFPASGRSIGGDLSRFCIVAAASFAVNYASFAILYSASGLPAITAQRVAILIAAPVTFLANRLWAFRARVPTSHRCGPTSASPSQAPATSMRSVSRGERAHSRWRR